MTRKERENLMHKEAICKASLRLFSSRGFHNVSMQDIAAESEFAVGTLYKFFPSKEQLFAELSKDCAKKIYQILWPILQTEEREDVKVRNFIKLHGKLVEDNIEFIKLYVSERGKLAVSKSSGNEQADNVKIVLGKKLENVINVGIQNEILRDVDAEITSLSIMASIQSLVFEGLNEFTKEKMEQGLAKLEHLFVDGLLLSEKHNNG